jgi:hypothetical protein
LIETLHQKWCKVFLCRLLDEMLTTRHQSKDTIFF